MARRLVTFDLFSALLDSRAGGSVAFTQLALLRRWSLSGEVLYDSWDGLNKTSQKTTRTSPGHWVTFADHARTAMAGLLVEHGLEGDPGLDSARLLSTIPTWPLWSDTEQGLAVVAEQYQVGVLSNVDDDLWRTTRVAALVEDAHALTSERLRSYKPSSEIYLRAREVARGNLIHVAGSARDVRGALEANIEVIRLRRPGHQLDPHGPRPTHEAADMSQVVELLTTWDRGWG